MDIEISHLKYDSSSLSFSWMCKINHYNKTTLFNFDDYYNKCYLKLEIVVCTGATNDIIMNVNLIFIENNPIENNELIDCIVSFDVIKDEKYKVLLSKEYSKEFSNPMEVIFSNEKLKDHKECLVNIELHFEKKNNNFLLENMNLLLSSGNYSDLKLTVENKVFNVHKSILGTRNNVLAKMIESSETETINLSKWNVIAVEELLNYIYTGDCDVSKNPQELFKVSHFLQIEELQDMCKNYLKSHIDGENLISVLKLAAQTEYNLSELKEATKSFIDENECAIAEDFDFIDYLSNSICLSNIEFALKFSKKHDVEKLLEAAMKFVYYNYEQVLKDAGCEKFLSSNPTLLFKILKYHKDDIAIINKIETLHHSVQND